jgi:hypothetical protein
MQPSILVLAQSVIKPSDFDQNIRAVEYEYPSYGNPVIYYLKVGNNGDIVFFEKVVSYGIGRNMITRTNSAFGIAWRKWYSSLANGAGYCYRMVAP